MDDKELYLKLKSQFEYLQNLYYEMKDHSDDIGEENNWLLDILSDVEMAKNDIYEYMEDLKEELE